MSRIPRSQHILSENSHIRIFTVDSNIDSDCIVSHVVLAFVRTHARVRVYVSVFMCVRCVCVRIHAWCVWGVCVCGWCVRACVRACACAHVCVRIHVCMCVWCVS